MADGHRSVRGGAGEQGTQVDERSGRCGAALRGEDGEVAVWQMDGDQIAGLSLCIKETLDGEVWGWVDDLCVLVGVFIHWEATDDKKIFDYNYTATKEAIARALNNEPAVSAVLESAEAARHPFAAGVEG